MAISRRTGRALGWSQAEPRRDRWLETEGYRVLRVPTIEVYGNIAGVVDTIWATAQEMPLVRARHHPHQERHRT